MISLVCDDDCVWGRAVSRALSGEVHQADTIESGLVRAAELQPHVILLDTILPDGIGWQAIPRFRAVSPRSEIVVVTALGKRTDGIRAIGEFGAFAYIEKTDGLQAVRKEMRRAFMASTIGSVRRWKLGKLADVLQPPLPPLALKRHLA